MTPLSNDHLIEKCEKVIANRTIRLQHTYFTDLLTRFKSLCGGQGKVTDKCPICGSDVIISHSEEGTGCYLPAQPVSVEDVINAVIKASHIVQQGEQQVKEETEKGTEYFTVDDTEYFIKESKLRNSLTKLFNKE